MDRWNERNEKEGKEGVSLFSSFNFFFFNFPCIRCHANDRCMTAVGMFYLKKNTDVEVTL